MAISAGSRLGPYEVLSPLGAGGMGEVYRALDPRLGREVAVKVLPEPVAKDPERLRRFEKEARAVGALNHPNILTVHDVGSHDGSPYVVTELLEGETLRELLLRRAPTTRQVLSWAVQAAQGLSAAHQKGIVHRDIKPENLFLTTDGRLKILDFGLAKLMQPAIPSVSLTDASTAAPATDVGVILGTVAYMSPEQVAAEGVDHRSDIFSLAIVLYELLSGENPFRRATVTATLTAILHEAPLDLSVRQPGILPAVERIVGRCLEKRREERYQSAHDLALGLEDVLERGSAAAALLEVEERSPYPGLSCFTEEDAGRFFGREEEVGALWRRLHDRQFLAVIGPSGAGKTSFVRAGVVAGRPEGWAASVATPGNSPLRGLGQALAPQLASDREALRKLVTFEDPETAFELLSRWRRNHDEALVVVDQFEELFTLNPAETQARFASLLGRLAREADVHVLLSLRDDFLMRCHEQEALVPVFEALTPLGPMTREGLRRAVIEPASKRGYRFEDEALVDEMVDAVEGARGALPLLAFAVSRLWERRDREKKLLTREAYREIGGVEGALAQHAEATQERIGSERDGIVREIFRNLTTAQGTRTVLDREELLSALPDRPAGEQALQQLVDARLLTSYETESSEGEPSHHRVEIVHESLLKAWPRLVRWQTQDADGAQLRDQLRQAAHLWEERGKTEDLLWTGASFLDYRAWRERYPGGLSSVEEDFAKSMASVADRKRRRRRVAVAAIVAALAVGLSIVAVLWNRSEDQRTRAQAATRRAEASKLLVMAQLEVDTDPAAALAYATKSVELDDTQVARYFALRVTQSAPIASVVPGDATMTKGLAPLYAFSPNGERLAVLQTDKILLLNQDGREPVTISPGEIPPGTVRFLAFGPDGKTLSVAYRDEVRLLSVPDGREVRHVKYEEALDHWCLLCRMALKRDGDRYTFFRRPWDGGEQKLIGTLVPSEPFGPKTLHFSRDFTALAYALGRRLYVKSPAQWASPPRLLGEHAVEIVDLSLSDNGQRLAAMDKSGEIRIWETASVSGRPLRVLPAPAATKEGWGVVDLEDFGVRYSAAGRWVVSEMPVEGRDFLRLWDLTAPPGAGPPILRTKSGNLLLGDTDPLDRGCAAIDQGSKRLLFWPLPHSQPRVFDWPEGPITSLAFTADGATLVAASVTGGLRAWPLSPEATAAFRTLPKADVQPRIAAAPTQIAVASRGRLQLIPVNGGEPRELAGLPKGHVTLAVAFSPDGRRVAAAPFEGPATEKRIRVWDLETGAVRMLEPVPKADDQLEGGFIWLSFVDNDRIVATVNVSGMMLYDLRDGKVKLLSSVINSIFALSRSRRFGVGVAYDEKSPSWEILRFTLDESPPVPLPYRTDGGAALALDPSETLLASTGADGVVRIGPVSGGEPHLFFGHRANDVNALAFSPDGKWLASAGDDQTVRLWPVPDMKQVPPHKRSHEEFLATLRTFTNLRAVPDAKSPNGWKLEPGPFPGWQTAPHW
jgi:WD40 repeat protein/tRNA A-37 threonylcarbamoyl transferase component Bud32